MTAESRATSSGPIPTSRTYAGIILVSCALLTLEIALTRIFSVLLWYHFAFLAISLALFGLAMGGLFLHFRPERFPRVDVNAQMSRYATLFAASVPISFLCILGVPFVYRVSLPAAMSLLLIYAFAAIPFFLGGVVIALALSRYASKIGPVYGADLLGAGLGCLITVPILSVLSGPGAVIAAAIIAGIGALTLGGGDRSRRMAGVTIVVLALLLLVHETKGILRIDFTKDHLEEEIQHQDWNALARVTVTNRGTPNWATSETYKGPKPETLWLKIDAEAGTPLVKFDGDFEKVRALQFDVSALAYTLRTDARVLIVGPGGGRDVLTALSFGHKDVTGVEINPAIINTVRNVFGQYTGGLYDRPGVQIVNAEGRSYVRRSKEKFDIIQASLIDTWAATSAGAYVLSENNLYTEEAFQDFLGHLTDDGILTMSRWFFKGRPMETLRLTAVAAEALRDLGSDDPAAHIMVFKRSTWDWAYRLQEFRDGVGTMLVKRTPWLPGEIEHMTGVAADLEFDLVYAPGKTNHPDFDRLFSGDREAFYRDYPVDISPPTDDRPFFFYMLRAGDAFRFLGGHKLEQGVMQNNVRAVFVLAALLVIVLLLTAGCIFLPLLVKRGEPFPRDPRSGLFLFYFFCLGLGYLLVEIPLLQRFILVLGHPVHALTVVLFAMLVGSGAGSVLSERVPDGARPAILAAVAFLIVVYVMLLPRLVGATLDLSFPARVAVSVIVLLPPAVLMGMPFPIGVRELGASRDTMMAWVWGVNGATSVCASVLATLLAISFGYSTVLSIGAAVYGVAFFTLLAGRAGPLR